MTLRVRNFLGCAALSSLLLGCDKPNPTAAYAATAAPGTQAVPVAQAAVPNSFQEVAAQLDAGGSFYLYLSTTQWLAGLSKQIADARELILSAAQPTATAPAADLARFYDVLVDVIGQSGIEEASGIGMSHFALAPQVNRSKFFIHHAPGKGQGFLWSIWGGAAHPLDALQILPPQTALAMVQDVDFTVLNNFLTREVERLGTPDIKTGYEQGKQQVASILGMPFEEALKSLTGPVGLIMTLDPSKMLQPQGPEGMKMPTPGLALVLHASDDRIFNQIDKTFGTNPQIIRVDEAGLKMRTMPDVPTPLGTTVRPTAALWGSYLVIASSDQIVRDMIAAKTNGFATTAEFQAMAADVPSTGNGFQVVTRTFSDFFSSAQAEMMKSQPMTTPQQAAAIKQMFATSAGASAFSVSANLENGLLSTTKTTSTGPQPNLGTLLSSMVAGFNASKMTVAVPEDEAAASLKKAQQIYYGCVRYAGDNAGKFPPNLSVLIPRYLPDAQALVSPYAPENPAGYNYTPGLTQDSPPETILVEDSQSIGKNIRITVRVNGKAETTTIP